MHKTSMKRIFKEPIFTAVDGESPLYDSTNMPATRSFIGARYRASRVVSVCIVEGIKLDIVENKIVRFMFHKIVHLLN